jgi:soluble lytic murein transglycosylase
MTLLAAPIAALATTAFLLAAPVPPTPAVPHAPPAPSAQDADTAAIRQAIERVTAAMELVDQERFGEAALAYDEAADLVPAFAPWAHLLAARALAGTGDTAGVRLRHQAAGDVEMVQEWGWSTGAEALLAAGDTAGALAHLERVRGAIANVERRAQATLRMGNLALALGRTEEAGVWYRTVLDAVPGSATGLEAAVALADSVGLAPADHLPVARVFLRHGELTRAIPLVEGEIAARPELEAQLRLETGLAHWNARRYADAERWLAPGDAAARTDDEVRAERVLYQARSQFRDGRESLALTTFRRLTAEHPGTPAAARAHFLLADLAHDDGKRDEAVRHYEAAVRAGGQDAALSAMRLVALHWTAGDRGRALEVLRSAGRPEVTTFDGQQRAYWLARSGDPAGTELLESLWRAAPFTYYGGRAAQALGRAGELPAPIRPWEGAVTPADAARAATIADRAAVLTGAALGVRAAYEVGRALEGESVPVLYALGDALHVRVVPAAGVRVGRTLQSREGRWNDALLRLVYPFPYRPAIERESRRNDLDPFLVAGLIRQESGFMATVRSPAGALGLMQIMPATGRGLARELGVGSFNETRLTEPELNVRMGTRYLATMLARYNGRVADALVAYNAGPTRMSRWREFPEHGDVELFIERIPFTETRNYVRIVETNAAIYRMLYGDG